MRALLQSRHGMVLLTALGAAYLVASSVEAPAASSPWWKDYHTVVSLPVSKLGQVRELGMMAERGAWATGWYGNWWIQYQVERRGKYDPLRYVERFRQQGVKNVFYFDAGEFGEFVGLAANKELLYDQWGLRFYRGEPGTLLWFGDDGFYRDEHLLNLKDYRDFGLPPWTMPDGTRPARLYDFSIRSLDGNYRPWDYSDVKVSPEVAAKLGLEAFLKADTEPRPPEHQMALGRIRTYDHSNPFLLEDFKVGVWMMLKERPAFIHFDNFFDNETVYPSWAAFGPWSLEKFKRFLQTQLTAEQRTALGITNPAVFDLKQYLWKRPLTVTRPGARWREPAWEQDRIWNAFIVSKYRDADQLFRGLYAFCKERSRALGQEVVVAGNTIPLFPGGALCSGGIDQVHFEYHIAHQYGPIVVPPGLPPRGKLGGAVRLAAALGTTGYCWPTIYVPREFNGPGHENLHKVLAFDCLANRGVMDYNYHYLDGYSPGSDESAGWIDCFIKNYSAYYGSRAPVADVGLVFPGQTLLASTAVFCMDPECCLYDYLGWAQAMTDLHYLWDAIPDNQLDNTDLGRFRVVVLPSVKCLSDKELSALLNYVQHGGRVIVSGEAGTRFGVEHFLWPRSAEQSLAGQWRAQPQSVACPTCPGKAYYTDGSGRPGERAEARTIDQALGQVVARRRMATPTPASLGVALYTEPGGLPAIDLVNYAVEPATDHLTPAPETRLTLWPAEGQKFPVCEAEMISPQWRTRAEGKDGDKAPTPWVYESKRFPVSARPDGGLDLVVPPFEVFVTVRLRSS